MKLETKMSLIHAWNYCDFKNKSIEFTMQFMSDFANVEYDTAADFMFNYNRTKQELDL